MEVHLGLLNKKKEHSIQYGEVSILRTQMSDQDTNPQSADQKLESSALDHLAMAHHKLLACKQPQFCFEN